jgi:hypothetical protein
MVYACPARRSAVRTHVRRLQVLQFKCLYLATGAPWYVSNMQIHEDLGVPLFADIRALTANFYSKLADVVNSLLRQIGRYLRWPRFAPSPDAKAKGGRGQQASGGHHLLLPSRLNESCSRWSAERFLIAVTRFFHHFYPVVSKCQGIRCKVGARPALPSHQVRRLHLSAWKKVAYLQFATKPV